MTPEPTENLRFALYARVSTEQQLGGASLEAQKAAIKQAVTGLGGAIVEEYGGQEHAMPGYERAEFDRMLSDVKKRRFDAVCVYDPSRWSRDQRQQMDAFEVLKAHGVRFFARDMEYDLHDETTDFQLGILGLSNGYSVKLNLAKSANSRIQRAKNGYVSSGHPPFGRYVANKPSDGGQAVWKLIEDADFGPEKNWTPQEYVQEAARLYLEGRTWAGVAAVIGDKEETIRRRVMASGSEWTQSFKRKGHQVRCRMDVPALLPPEVLAAVRAKSEAHHLNRRSSHVYALSRYLRCGHCGSVLSTHTHPNGTVYTQHHQKTRQEGCYGGGRYDRIEKDFLYELAALLRRTDGLEAAVRRVMDVAPDEKAAKEARLKDVRKRLAQLEKELESCVDELLRTPEGPTRDVLRDESQKRDDAIRKARAEESQIVESLKVEEVPADLPDQVKAVVQWFQGKNTTRTLFSWSPEEQRALVQLLFGMKRPKRQLDVGIFLEVIDRGEENEHVKWTARGWFGALVGASTNRVDIADRYSTAYDVAPIDPERLAELVRPGRFNGTPPMGTHQKPGGSNGTPPVYRRSSE